ncbi:MAG: thiamine pyrophosphate-binding protein [Tatlockia sp.]|nr:thiamine pyrophosphate-binding protein [Tatlockia sp.]
MIKSSQYIIKYLEHIGIQMIFGVGGANVEDLYNAAAEPNSKLQAIIAKQEFGAYCMAEAYSHLKPGLGVVITTSGPGAMNIVPGLAESYASNSSVLALIGQPIASLQGKGAFQDTSGLNDTLNSDVLFKTLGHKYFFHIRAANELPEQLFRAVSASLSEPTGPAILAINKDVYQQGVKEDNPFFLKQPEIKTLEIRQPFEATEAFLDKFFANQPSPRIVIIAGSGLMRTDSETLLNELALKLNARIVCTPSAKSLIDKSNQLFKGMIGITAHDAAIKTVFEADLVIVVGTRLSVTSSVGIGEVLATKTILYINNQNSFISFDQKQNHQLLGSIPLALNKLLSYFSNQKPLNPPSTWSSNESFQLKEPVYFHSGKKTEMNSKDIFSIISQSIEKGALIYVDAGNTGAAALHYLEPATKSYYEIALGMGGMGYAICAGIGAALYTKKRVYIIAGDGAFLMTGMEIHTAVENQLPIVLIILNNDGHAMCKTREKLFFDTEYNYDLFKNHTHFAKGLAALFPGLTGFQVDTISELKNTLKKIKNNPGPICLDITISADEIPPFLPFVRG